MNTIQVKPLSTNAAWRGRRFKTDKYKDFETYVLLTLKKQEIPEGKLCVELIFGFSNAGSDIDNPVKMMLDVLSKKNDFNDNRVYQLSVTKTIVKKGDEFIKYKITNYN